MAKQRIEEVDIAKGIGILLVLLGHSFPDANIGIQNTVAASIFNWIYSFHMPLFMAMAGMLFYPKYQIISSRHEKICEIRNKAERVLVPYFFYSLLVFVVKLVTNLGRKKTLCGSFIGVFFGTSPCGNMWFLWTLFILSTLVLLNPFKLKPELILAGGGILYFTQNAVSWFDTFGIAKICNMLLWFALGMVMKKYIARVGSLKNIKQIPPICCVYIATFAIQLLLLILRSKNEIAVLGLFYKMALAMLGILIVWISSMLLSLLSRDSYIKRWLCFFGKESMVFYVLSYFIQTPGVTFYCKKGSIGIPYCIWVLGLFISAILFSLFVSKIVKKSKLFSRLMLGV